MYKANRDNVGAVNIYRKYGDRYPAQPSWRGLCSFSNGWIAASNICRYIIREANYERNGYYMIPPPALKEVEQLEENPPKSINKILLLGSTINILENLKLFFKDCNPRLIFLDLSLYYITNKIELREEIKETAVKKELKLLKLPKIKEPSVEFWKKIEKIIDRCRLLLDEEGFIAVKVNGTIKSSVKSGLNNILGTDRFVNEIIIDSPYKVWYAPNSSVFERTDYVLLYSHSNNPRINPVLNEKESGGYWHSFVSKGQGTPKKFVFKDGEELLLAPPPGTHWKLKQETILDLCAKGQIRLNKKGNPEYWVPRKEGQIIDSNWLDIPSYQWILKYLTNSSVFYKRLLNLCLKGQDLFLDLSPNLGVSLLVADQLNVRWIGLEEEKYLFQLMMKFMTDKGTFISAYDCKSLPDLPVIQYPESDGNDIIPDLSSQDDLSIRLIERYKGQKLNEEQSNGWMNMLILGDVGNVLPGLSKKLIQKVKLIYIDPPFFTGTDEKIVIPIGVSEKHGFSSEKISDYPYEDLAYKNILEISNPIEFFKQWFKKRVLLMKSFLRDDGHIFVRFDYHFGHYARRILDKVFGSENFVNEFLVRRMKKNLSLKQAYNQTHLIVHSDSLFVYQRSEKAKLNPITIKKKKRKGQDLAERQYFNDNLWIDIAGYEKLKKTLYPTENSETLLSRIIEISTKKGDLVADFFCGSGTTLAVAEKLGRNWVGVDIGRYSIHEVRKRLLKLPNNNPFEIYRTISAHPSLITVDHPLRSETSPLMVKLDVKIDENKLNMNIVDFVPSRLINRTKSYDFIHYIDCWTIDWDHQEIFEPKWYSCREMRGKKVLSNIQASVTHEYSRPGKYLITASIYDIFGNNTRQSIVIEVL
ncbi:MAG: DNA methyltransferase [Candidatus Thorarchaeota archaeon]